jgi:endonuclease/exonuclease/phosphatase family metal-dependent hydrolase
MARGGRLPGRVRRRILCRGDRILVDRSLRIEEAGVHASAEARKASDHLPVWARLTL